MRFRGIPIGDGIAIGIALKIEEPFIDTRKKPIQSVEEELRVYQHALHTTVQQLDHLITQMKKRFSNDTAGILEAQKLMATDPEVNQAIVDMIETKACNVAHAVQKVSSKYVDLFSEIEDPYLKERAVDFKDVTRRMLKNIHQIPIIDFASINQKVILLAEDFTPSELSLIDPEFVLGFVTRLGGKNSHSAIIARLIGLPTVFGVDGLLMEIQSGKEIILDGSNGDVITDFDEKTRQIYKQKSDQLEQEKQELKLFMGKPTKSLDRHAYQLQANITSKRDLVHVHHQDAEGIGLFRTEFLFFNRQAAPSEDEQFQEYKTVLLDCKDKPVIIRTIDIGGDKHLPYLNLKHELNPFLGKRALRLCFDELDLFKTQIRAMLRASIYGQLKIMFPMVATKSEVVNAKRIVDDVKRDMDIQGIAYSPDVQIGVMIEIPSSALMADSLAKEVDFFSIGTNDLIQYVMAADRTSQDLMYLYQPFHPVILRLIKMVADAGRKHGIQTSVCGEMASDLRAVPILLGLGVQQLSMTPSQILKTRKLIASMNHTDMEKLALRVLKFDNESDVLSEVQSRFNI
ncbi:MAG: phosphoenolpyruvate--protein phosphotransferase [Acholeplasmataceae bacterium]|nr:phosphoenolpyruvate--protein phosphotransferase [Acholeplasmataceae bacterium]